MAKGKKTGGRQKGSRNKRLLSERELIEEFTSKGLSPLEVLLRGMKKALETGKDELAFSLAKDAAPYCHSRLTAIEHSGEITKTYVMRSPEPSTNVEQWQEQHSPGPTIQ